MDTAYFGGNCEFKRNFHQVCTFHANCLYSLQDKVEKLNAVLHDWKQFKAEPNWSMLGFEPLEPNWPQRCLNGLWCDNLQCMLWIDSYKCTRYDKYNFNHHGVILLLDLIPLNLFLIKRAIWSRIDFYFK
jgi:hypothetical protein